jgi:oligopeptide/dipeptide ABC transporter ATP-binding protein
MGSVTSSIRATDCGGAPGGSSAALEVRDISVRLQSRHGSGRVIDGVSFAIGHGEVFGLVGESGSGKSMTALAIMRLLPDVASVVGGEVRVGGANLLALDEREMRTVRAATIGMIFQQARSSLNPLMQVGAQIARVMRAHGRAGSRRQARERALAQLNEVGLTARVARSYPHQLSGGMAQRALVATVLGAQPQILIADEPTTGLDVTTEAEIYDLLTRLCAERGLSLLLITHDLAVVGQYCDRVGVMHAGNLVEVGDVKAIFERPLHPYTRGLLDAIPRLDTTEPSPPALIGEAPRLADLPLQGCRFIERCPHRMPKCAEEVVPREVERGHRVLCRLYE